MKSNQLLQLNTSNNALVAIELSGISLDVSEVSRENNIALRGIGDLFFKRVFGS